MAGGIRRSWGSGRCGCWCPRPPLSITVRKPVPRSSRGLVARVVDDLLRKFRGAAWSESPFWWRDLVPRRRRVPSGCSSWRALQLWRASLEQAADALLRASIWAKVTEKLEAALYAVRADDNEAEAAAPTVIDTANIEGG